MPIEFKTFIGRVGLTSSVYKTCDKFIILIVKLKNTLLMYQILILILIWF